MVLQVTWNYLDVIGGFWRFLEVLGGFMRFLEVHRRSWRLLKGSLRVLEGI